MMDIGKDLQNAYEEGYKQGRYDEMVETEMSLPEWIPVSEGLPSKGQVVLAIGDKGTWDVGMFHGLSPSHSNHLWWWKKKTIKRVDYWMPKAAIPLPCREDGE